MAEVTGDDAAGDGRRAVGDHPGAAPDDAANMTAAAGETTAADATEGTGDASPAAPDAPDEVVPRGAITTTMVHRGGRGHREWWRSGVVYELTAHDLGGADLDAVVAGARYASRLGAHALLIHPGTSPADAPEAAATLLRRTDRLGLRLLVSVPDGQDRLAVLRHWLEVGAEGVDVGVVPAPDPRAAGRVEDLGAVQALIAAETEDGILAAATSAEDPDALLARLQEVWPHHLRDDRLVRTPWSAPALRRTITEAYAQRDPLGAPMVWALHDPVHADGQAVPEPAPLPEHRIRALTLLALALPGAVHLRQGEQVGLTDGAASAGPGAADRADKVRGRVAEQAGRPGSTYEMFRLALRLRSELGLSTGPLGWVSGLHQAAAETTVAFVNRQVLVLLNTGEHTVHLPPTAEVLHASTALLPAPSGGVAVPPSACVWAQLDQRER
ncbi:hypothetical protein PU560_13100 [Georgenia sp. 10Sc9-8]|uniref:DUF3459 domain-containing protein n=1 Tax=Georgenia halotolerans TaxID=3028317 RepID=A0ABT5TZ96_9MICO|nr:hypothetical protein [Georgenia halotolerans]